ncbi:MAG: secretin N-terminal domain-containing protein [Thiohalophilus sp.]
MKKIEHHGIGLLLLATLLLAGCATQLERTIDQAEAYASRGEWTQAVIEYRKALNRDPGSIALKSRLQQAEMKAADYYYQKGRELLEQGNIDGAAAQFQQGLVAKPRHSKLTQAMQDALARKEADELYTEALRNQELEKHADARALLKKALEIYPGHKKANELHQAYLRRSEAEDKRGLVLESKEPITLNFKQTELKTAFDFIVSEFGINVIFDEAVKDDPVTLYASDVTFEQALNLMLRTTQTFYKQIGRNTILIAPDSSDKRGQYEDHIIRTYHLKSVAAKEMSNILKSVLGIKKLIVNEELNSIIIRDTGEMLELAEKLIATNDRKPAEVLLEVEILEVNRTKAEQLGLDFGSQIGISYDPFVGSFGTALAAGTVTLPDITFRYFKQDVDAKTLANPKLRVMDSKQAKIHIGDRIPLRSSTIQDATGQTRTTFEYRDVGIRLQVEPDIHLDNAVTVQLNLEVSSLGQNLGTSDEPAFSIGTRNADTFMLLKDGETAILGGLIRDEDRRTRVKVPGLGEIPVIGSLFFTNYDDSTTRTDVLLTITPRIVRPWILPGEAERRLYSGTQDQYTTRPLFAFLQEGVESGDSARIKLGETDATADPAPSAPSPSTASAAGQRGILSFGQPTYTIGNDQEVSIALQAENFPAIGEMPVELLFNPNLMEFVGLDKADIDGEIEVTEEADKGIIRLNLRDITALPEEATTLARLKLKSKQTGVSYLIYKSPTYTDAEGESQRANIRASRIVIQ